MDAADPRIDYLSGIDCTRHNQLHGTLLVHLGASAPILHSKSSKREIPVDQSLWGFFCPLRPSELFGATGDVAPLGVACANEPLGAQIVDLRCGLLVTLLYCICCCCHLITSLMFLT